VTIKAIETRYSGCRFRSRLEARWAVFFDAIGFRWEYEPQGYIVDGTPYLPDFKLILPDEQVMFSEVKSDETDDHEGVHVRLCRGLAKLTSIPIILLTGLPAYRMYHLFTPQLDLTSFHAAFFKDYPSFVEIADWYWWQAIECDERTGRLNFRLNERAARKSFGRRLVEGVQAARSARFEHGDTPLIVPAPGSHK
jgi:hypothetical protein